ncbi:hypothetical protein [Streptomyces californicus]|uniref:hypothetical protein n=1 Tax=Streptomyces californicus TaxID=67351 RepID=UPI0033251F6C
MENEWIEPGAHKQSLFRDEQVERGRKLVARDDLLTSERQRTRLEIGDLLLEIAPPGESDMHNGTHRVIAALASEIGIAPNTAREYRMVAAGYQGSARKRVAESGVTVSYSVIREAAIDITGSGTPAAERWEKLFALLDDPNRMRVTVPEFRSAIGAQAVAETAAGLSPEQVVKQLSEQEDLREAVIAAVMEPDFLREVLLADPMAEVRVRDSLAEIGRLTRKDVTERTEDGDERLIGQLRSRLRLLLGVSQMAPEQVVSIADEGLLDELSTACARVSRWVDEVQNARTNGRTVTQ